MWQNWRDLIWPQKQVRCTLTTLLKNKTLKTNKWPSLGRFNTVMTTMLTPKSYKINAISYISRVLHWKKKSILTFIYLIRLNSQVISLDHKHWHTHPHNPDQDRVPLPVTWPTENTPLPKEQPLDFQKRPPSPTPSDLLPTHILPPNCWIPHILFQGLARWVCMNSPKHTHILANLLGLA